MDPARNVKDFNELNPVTKQKPEQETLPTGASIMKSESTESEKYFKEFDIQNVV